MAEGAAAPAAAPLLPASVAKAAAQAVLCCLPTTPCGDVGSKVACSLVDAPGGCAALARTREWEDPRDCGTLQQPSWNAMVAPLFGMPLLSLQATLVLWIVLGYVYRGLWRLKCFRSAMNTHVGTLGSPMPRSVCMLVSMLYSQLALSICTVLVFIGKTYLHKVPVPIIWAEAMLGFMLAGDFLFSGCKQEFRLASILDLGILVDIVTLPGMLVPWIEHMREVRILPHHSHWITLSFLRCIQAVSASEKLHAIRPSASAAAVGSSAGVGEESYEIIKTLVRFLALMCCFSSMVLVFEVLGEPDCLKFEKFATAMGDIDFFTMVYWVMETVSTVGYGDFAPKTVLSKWCTIVGMFAGVAFFTIQVGSMLQIMSKQKMGTGEYKRTKHGHIVLVGGGVCHVDETLLVAFVQELYHLAYKTHWPDMVVMSGDTESLGRVRDIVDQSVDHQARQHMTFLLGSPLNVNDLDRCCGDQARCVYILSDTTGFLDPWNEDKENMIRALSVQQRFPKTQLRLMLLMRDSVERAGSMGLSRHLCFSINQMKSGLFWQSCRCVGWSSMLSNLMVTTDAIDADDEDDPWLHAYLGGMDHEIYGFLPVPELQGVSFSFLVQEAYKRKGVCIFAAQIQGDIVLAPLRQLQTVGFTVLFALAADEENLRGIALESHNVDWQTVFAKRRAINESKGSPQGLAVPTRVRSFASAIVQDEMSHAQSAKRFSSLWMQGSMGVGSLATDGAFMRSPLDSSRSLNGAMTPSPSRGFNDSFRGSMSTGVSMGGIPERSALMGSSASVAPVARRTVLVTESASMHEPSMSVELSQEGKVHLASRSARELEVRAARIRQNAPATPFVVVLELTGSLEQLSPILAQRMATYLPFRLPMIVLCPIDPKEVAKLLSEEPGLAEDQSFAFVTGSPFWVPDLERAGVRECTMIVSIGQGATGGVEGAEAGGTAAELVSMLDVDVVLLHRMIVNLSETARDMLFDFQRTENMRLLPRPPTASMMELSAGGEAGAAGAGDAAACCSGEAHEAQPQGEEVTPPYCDRRFASGQIFTTQVFASLFARTYHSPGAVEVTQALMTPDSQMSSASADSRANFTWQVKLTSEQAKMTYGELLMKLTSGSNPVLPLGVYRSFGAADGYGNSGFVWTNPPADTPMQREDMLYVLGDQIFGHMAYMQGLLPMAGS